MNVTLVRTLPWKIAGVTPDATTMGTFGQIFVDKKLFGPTLEPPWRENRCNLSCIPAGEYPCRYAHSPRWGMVFFVEQVPGRSHVRIHQGNLGGDTELKLKTHTQGCLILGSYTGSLSGQQAVLNSLTAVKRFHDKTMRKPFILKIQWAGEPKPPTRAGLWGEIFAEFNE